jgi:hypothetical protein
MKYNSVCVNAALSRSSSLQHTGKGLHIRLVCHQCWAAQARGWLGSDEPCGSACWLKMWGHTAADCRGTLTRTCRSLHFFATLGYAVPPSPQKIYGKGWHRVAEHCQQCRLSCVGVSAACMCWYAVRLCVCVGAALSHSKGLQNTGKGLHILFA